MHLIGRRKISLSGMDFLDIQPRGHQHTLTLSCQTTDLQVQEFRALSIMVIRQYFFTTRKNYLAIEYDRLVRAYHRSCLDQ